jgi:hypothetical protein
MADIIQIASMYLLSHARSQIKYLDGKNVHFRCHHPERGPPQVANNASMQCKVRSEARLRRRTSSGVDVRP